MNPSPAAVSAIVVLGLAGLGIWYLLFGDSPRVPAGPEAAVTTPDAVNSEASLGSPVRTPLHSIEPVAPGDSLTRLRVQVSDLDRRNPVAGVSVRIEAEGLQVGATTDRDGACDLAWPSASAWALLSATAEDGLVLDMPRRITPGDRLCSLVFTRSITLFGVVRDPQGRGLPQARVFLTEPKLQNTGRARLESSLLTQADAAGLYRVEVTRAWHAGSSLVAVASPWIPAAASLADVRASTSQLDLQLAEGCTWRVRVVDGAGLGVRGCRLRLTTSDSPLLGEWTPDEVPEGAGGDLGLVSKRVETDEGGVATIDGWPCGRGAIVRVFNERTRRFRVIEAPGVAAESGKPMVIAASDLPEAEVHVLVETRTTVRVSGRLEGFSSAEAGRIRVTRVGADGGNEVGSLRLLEAGAFEAEFGQWRSDLGHRIELTLVATMDGSDWRQDLGSYELNGDPVLPGVILRR